MTTLLLTACLSCQRNLGDGTCTAFPEGIPEDIWTGIADHRVSRDGELTYLTDPEKTIDAEAWKAKVELIESEELVATTFHLPGKHNQKSHGRRGGGYATGQAAYDAVEIKIDYGDPQDVGDVSSYSVSDALFMYTEQGPTMNTRLRKGDLKPGIEGDDQEIAVHTMDKIVASSTFTQDAIVFRGVNDPAKTFGDAWTHDRKNAGLTWKDAGYTSTSPHESTVAQFAGGSTTHVASPTTEAVMLRVHVRQGTHAVAIVNDYDEIVLPRGSSFQITSDSGPHMSGDKEPYRIVDVEVEP